MLRNKMSALVDESMFKKGNDAIILAYLAVKDRSLADREAYLNKILATDDGPKAIYDAYLKARKKLVKYFHQGSDDDRGAINSDGEDRTSDNFQLEYLFTDATGTEEERIQIEMRVFRDLDIAIGNAIMQERLTGLNLSTIEEDKKNLVGGMSLRIGQ